MPCLNGIQGLRKRQEQLLETARYRAMREQYLSFIGNCWDTNELCEKIKLLLWEQYTNKLNNNDSMVDYCEFQIAACQQQLEKVKLRLMGNLPIPPESSASEEAVLDEASEEEEYSEDYSYELRAEAFGRGGMVGLNEYDGLMEAEDCFSCGGHGCDRCDW